MGLKSSLWSAMPFAAMVMVECGSIGLTTLSKAAMRRGMSNFVFILYSYILATLLLLPFLFICRRAKHPPLTFSILCRLFLLGIVSCISQILQYEGIRSSSPILNSATDNILPAFIFILAIIFRMEPLALKSSYGRAKLLGTLVSITGAFVVTLYKGPSIFISNSSASNLAHQRFLLSPKSNWVFGGFLLSLHILALAFLFIIQASIVKDYQAEFSITFFYCFFGSIPTAFISVIAEKDPSAWILRPNLELIAIIYSKENTKRLMEEVKFSSQTTPSHQRFNVAGLPLLLVSIASHTFAVRMERLSLKSSYGQAKLLGTLVSVTGAFVVTFYRGPSIIRTSSTSNSSDHHHHQQLLLFPKSSWVFGGFLLSLHTLVVAFLHIIQASIVNDYQAEFPIAFFYCFFASIQTTLISLVAERDPSAWRLRPNLELIAIIYAAIFGCAIRSLVNLWCLGKNGPVYVAMFKPFGIVIAVVTSSTFLRDSLYLGSVVGSAIISVGFYAVMWGKAKEWKIAKDIEEYSLMSTTERVPLL
ncbi:PREDICTED: WAT1-related protein At3g28050-like isoform X7 [Nelumbo nucifera]|uniref:WAT1-related protein At3g28050-like isoform X7 n=1 Tax=Nelumbo nucifera TaxID=4432 RepID=A0A1U8Q4Y5_NELNU|nr:PREDICTED: WAT1-related protein At3g28050-like isoform X7 [Nelumbo nucifera]